MLTKLSRDTGQEKTAYSFFTKFSKSVRCKLEDFDYWSVSEVELTRLITVLWHGPGRWKEYYTSTILSYMKYTCEIINVTTTRCSIVTWWSQKVHMRLTSWLWLPFKSLHIRSLRDIFVKHLIEMIFMFLTIFTNRHVKHNPNISKGTTIPDICHFF